MRKLSVVRVRAVWWALRACGRAGRLTATGNFSNLAVGPPPALPDSERGAVVAVLRRRQASCLVRTLVLQAWDAAHDRPRDLIIGVKAPRGGFAAHAWLEGDSGGDGVAYSELIRRAAPVHEGSPRSRHQR